MTQLKIRRTHHAAVMPQYMSAGAGAFDIACTDCGVIYPGESGTIPTGISMEIPEGFTGFIFPRSGMGVKLDIDSHMGVIDRDYRGEVKVHLRNLGTKPFEYIAGDRVAQMVIMPTPAITIVEAFDLSETERGEGGFGSTGK